MFNEQSFLHRWAFTLTPALGSNFKQCTYLKLIIFFPYYNLDLAFQHFLPSFSFQFKLSMAIMGFFFLSIISVMVDITLQLQFTCNVWFPFFSRQPHSFSVPFEDSFRICRKRLPIHIANTFTNVLVNLHCRQIWAVLWIPAVSRFDSSIQFFICLHWLQLLCSSTGKLCFKTLNGISPFYSPLLTSDWAIFLTHFSGF